MLGLRIISLFQGSSVSPCKFAIRLVHATFLNIVSFQRIFKGLSFLFLFLFWIHVYLSSFSNFASLYLKLPFVSICLAHNLSDLGQHFFTWWHLILNYSALCMQPLFLLLYLLFNHFRTLPTDFTGSLCYFIFLLSNLSHLFLSIMS